MLAWLHRILILQHRMGCGIRLKLAKRDVSPSWQAIGSRSTMEAGTDQDSLSILSLSRLKQT